MKPDRLERYFQKIQIIEENLEELTNWLKEFESKSEISLPRLNKYAIFHAYQIIVEAITDVNAMLVKDLKNTPKDDYENINLLNKKKLLPEDMIQELKFANGLRNRIVHDYNGLLDSLAFEGIRKHIILFPNYIELISEWLTQN